MLKQFTLAAAAAGAIALGTLSFSAPSEATAGIYTGTPAVESNVIDARCWRGRWGRWHCGHRHWRHRHCWWRHGYRHCRW